MAFSMRFVMLPWKQIVSPLRAKTCQQGPVRCHSMVEFACSQTLTWGMQ